MSVLANLYRKTNVFARIMSFGAHVLSNLQKPYMVYGFKDPISKQYYKYTRMSSTVTIMSKENLKINNYVWVWHYSILDATEGIEIGEGAQIGAWVGIFTHGSENSIRLLGEEFVNIPNKERLGYTRGRVKIGAYTFIGAKATVLPGVTIGKGCLIASGAIVAKDVPDYSIVVGQSIVSKRTYEKDMKFFKEHDYSATYYDSKALSIIKDKGIEEN